MVKIDKKIFWLLITLIAQIEAEDFISEFEYGQMLYQNPRGVSCAPCHGDRGEGAEIARYINKSGKEVVVKGPNIRGKSIKDIAKAVSTGKGVMPRYFLTKEEIRAIYLYIKEVKERQALLKESLSNDKNESNLTTIKSLLEQEKKEQNENY